jgi:PKD repeat protein
MRYILFALAILAILAIPSMSVAQNLPPVADAGGDRDVYTGETAILTGSASDPDGDAISGWYWQAADVPAGADWTFDYTNTPTPYFTANTPGDYVLLLIVLDSRGAISAPDYATIHVVANLPPVAIATADVTEGPAPLTVQFDGSQSYDPEGKPLVRYAWDFGDGMMGSFAAVPPPHTYFVPGIYNVVILAVTDEAGAVGSTVLVIKVTEPGPVAYSWSDFLQPIDAPDANRVSKSVFKAGSTVPVKFKLTGDSAGITDLAATLLYAKVSDGIVGTDLEAVSTAAATTGNLFRYDSASGQYIFNWSTKGLTPGAYQLSVNLGDGVSRTVIISLK